MSSPGLGLCVFNADLAPMAPAQRRSVLAAAADAGLDHLHIGDHVSFHGGYGWDGLVQATALLNLQDELRVHVGLYQLPLRHPTVVARQLSTLCEPHPGRLVLAVGVGGDDRHEMEVCGVDPRTRGKRMDEGLRILRELLTGRPVSFRGEVFTVEDAVIQPAVDPPLPILVGGRSPAALRRAGRLGDGWLAIWVSPRRFAESIATVAEEAERAGRDAVAWRHGITVWCELGPDRARATERLATNMEEVYRLPREAFERWCPAGPPEHVAEFVAPYFEAGATDVTLIARGEDLAATIEMAAEVRRLAL